MTTLRSCSLWCLALAFAAMPLRAQDERPSPPRGIPDGTTFLIRLEDKLDASRVQPGKHFKAKLADGRGPAPAAGAAGSRTHQRGRQRAPSSSAVSFDEIETQRGWVPLMATVTGVPGEHGLKTPDDEGEIERQGSNRRREVETAGVGAGVGAIGGGAVGGGRGAAIGAGVGAAAGVVEALFSDRRLMLQKGTMLEVRLDRPLEVPWR